MAEECVIQPQLCRTGQAVFIDVPLIVFLMVSTCGTCF